MNHAVLYDNDFSKKEFIWIDAFSNSQRNQSFLANRFEDRKRSLSNEDNDSRNLYREGRNFGRIRE